MEDPKSIALLIVIVACLFWVTEWIPLYATSFLVLFLELVWLLPSMEAHHFKFRAEDFLVSFFSDTILLFLGGIVLSKAISAYGLDRDLVIHIIRFCKGSMRSFFYSIVFTTSFLSFWMNNTSTATLMLGLCYPILEKIPQDSGWKKAILIAIPFASNIGGMGTPVGSAPNAIAVEYLTTKGWNFGFLDWMMVSFPIVLVLNGILIFLIPFLFCRNEKDMPIQADYLEDSAIDSKFHSPWKKIVLIIICLLTILGWFTTGIHGLSNGKIALIPVIFFFGLGFLQKKDFYNISWDVLFLIGGGISLGKAMEHTGLAETILQSLFQEEPSIFLSVVILSLSTLILSSIMSNTATANLMIPMALGFSGQNFPIVAILIALSASAAMPLPISTPPNAIAFSYGVCKAKDMVLSGSIVTIFGFLGIVTLGFFLASRILGGGS